MRKLILAALMGATLVPGAAMAQNRELWRDRQDIRQERHDLDRAYRSGDRREDYREARQEYREDRRDYRRDNWGRDDWQNHRRYNRDAYRGGNWRSDYRYRAFNPGVTLGFGYYQPRYHVNDYSRYRLPNPGWNRRWVRHYNDVLLVDVRSGQVLTVHRNFYW
jgi:Ni/Co efflux regulator RcnB